MTLQPHTPVTRIALSLRSLVPAWPLLAFALLPLTFAERGIPQTTPYPTTGCVTSIANISSQVDATGSFIVSNVPVTGQQYRVKTICPQPNGNTLGAISAPLVLIANGFIDLPAQPVGPLLALPSKLLVQNLGVTLGAHGSTVQLEVQGIHPDGGPEDVTAPSNGTTYVSSNPLVAAVDPNGLVTAVAPGVVYITASNDGLSSTIMMTSFAALDSDGDGMPDAWEIANGLNPYDPSDANIDLDGDGLTNLQEYQLGTNPRVADTDGDGLNDGDEVRLGTNPLVADTDGDGLSDGDEVRLGTNPLLADTDGDGIPDGIEVKLGLNPLVPDAVTIVTGHVSQPDGTPSVRTSVTLFTYFNTVTDTSGTFTIANIPAGLGKISASAQAIINGVVYSASSTSVPPVASAVTDVGTIQLGQTNGQVSGYVRTPDNKPSVGTQIVVTSGANSRTAITDGAGLYSVSGLPAGPVMAAAFDPATSLRGQALGTLPATGSLSLNIALASFGTVTGTVRNAAGVPVGPGVAVAISGAFNATTSTDALGHYNFAFVSLGTVILDATDGNGNHGRSSGIVTVTAQNLPLDVQYLPRGTVSGVVKDGSGNLTANAVVMLRNDGQVTQNLTTNTNSLGQYSFTGVYAGPLSLSATYAATNAGGTTTATLTTDGQAVIANITLTATGSLTGTVYRADGTTVVPNAAIALPYTAFTATSDAQGKYQIINLPLGAYQVTARDNLTSDRGAATANLTTAGATATQDVKLAGLGSVKVTVLDGSGINPVPSAQVSVNSSAPLNTQVSGVTGSDGTVTLSGLLTGDISVTANDPISGLAGTGHTTLGVNGNAAVSVSLQPAGTILGKVFRSDATTPVAGAYVQLEGRRTQTDAGGNYRFDVVPSGTHALQVFDSLGNLLTQNNGVSVTTQGQVVTANFVIVGRGTVRGTITNADGSVAPGIPVQVISFASGANTPFGTSSDAQGFYSVTGVPLGGVSVIAQQHTTTTNSYGNGNGTVTSEDAVTTVDVQLSSSLVPTKLTLTDANGETYPIRETGALVNGSFDVFAGDLAAHEGGSILSLSFNGTETPFTGQLYAPVDQNGRQISITQSGIDGLNVTRRVYVPSDGYFARYLELVSNPGASDVTVDVKLTSNFRNETRRLQTATNQIDQVDFPRIQATSSGDTILNPRDPQTPDNWVVLTGPADDDPFLIYKPNSGAPVSYRNQPFTLYSTLPAVADVFDGPGGRLAPTSAGYSTGTGGAYAALTETYAAVKVPAGGTVGLLHFLSLENSYAGASATASRLVQLPPEALAGLSSIDLATVANFVIPANGVSTLPALPPINNAVSGIVYAAGGALPVVGAGVSLQSSDTIFSRVYTTATDGNGGYVFQGAAGGPAIPAEIYTVTATHPLTQVLSPPTPGSFQTAATASSQNIVFNNTATFTGTVMRGPVVLNTAGTVLVSGGGLATPIRVPIAADGTYTLTGVPVDNSGNASVNTYSITASVTGTLLTGTVTAVARAGATVQTNITIGGAGNLSGLVTRPDHSLAINDSVYLAIGNGSQLSALVDTSGHYLFVDVPVGSYSINAYDAQSNAALTVSILITSNTTTTQDLALQNAGVVSGSVTANDGSSVSGLTVTLTSVTSARTQTLTGITTATGTYTINGVQPGSLTARVTTPAGLQGTGTGSLPLAGQSTVVNIYLTSAGNVTGTVYQAGGTTPAAGLPVRISPAPLTGSATTTTDSNGQYSFQNEPFGGFTVSVTNPANGDSGSASSQIQTNGQLRTVNVTLTGFGNLTVTVLSSTGVAFPGAALTVYSSGSTRTGTTDSTGSATFTQLPAGNVSVVARDPSTGLSAQNNLNVPANSNSSLTLTLQSFGTIQGTVFAVDGVTPVSGATVQLNAPYGASTTTSANGTYSFTQQAIGGSYAVSAYDATGTFRAKSAAQVLQNSGQVLTENLTFVAVGSVSGIVTNMDGSRAENLTLSIVSQNPVIGGSQRVTTGGDGTYSVPEVPVGAFTVTVLNLPNSQAGFGRAAIASDGDHQTVNIQIISSTVTLPVTLVDGDFYPYSVQTNGAYTSGLTNSLDTTYTTFSYAQGLQVAVTGGSSASFGDGSSPTTSIQTLSGQGIEIAMPSLAGLTATRKIYVPSNGYFARRLDVLQNPSNTPVTVQVTVQGGEHLTLNYPLITATSNGTTTVDNTIQWAVSTDNQRNLPYPRGQLAIADVFTNTGAAVGMASVKQATSSYQRYQPNQYGNYQYFTYSTLNWTYTYNTVTIPANGSVGFLFFTAQEGTPATGASAAARLVGLPAEALTGLSAAELASIVNFAVPANPLPAATQPPIAGPISGHVYTGDGAIAIPNVNIFEQSTDVLYGATTTVAADANGAYTLPSFQGMGYAIEAVDPAVNITSPTLTGTITAPLGTSTTQDILFTNTGILQGTIRSTGGSTFSSASVYIASCRNYATDLNCLSTTVPVTNGAYRLLDVPAGTASLQAYITTPSGSQYNIPANSLFQTDVPAKQTTDFSFTLPATGNISGTVTNADGTAATNVTVSITPGTTGIYASVKTDATGKYMFTSVQLDTYTIGATDPVTKNSLSKTTTVTQDTTQVVNFQFIGKGTINATVKFANGNIAANTVLLISTSTTPAFGNAGYTDANGMLTINNVPTGAFIVRATYPNQNFVSNTPGTITADAQVLTLAVTLPPVGTISGKVTYADGTPAANQYVQVFDQTPGTNSYSNAASTDSAGSYAVTPVPADHIVVVTSNYYDQVSGRTLKATANNQQVPGDSQTLTVNLRYPGVATVAVTVQNADGTKVTSGTVVARSSDGTNYTGSLSASGLVTLANVIEGSYVAFAYTGYSSYNLGSKLFTIQPADDGKTVAVTITASPVGIVQGQVYAADGTTRLVGNYSVKLLDIDTAGVNYFSSGDDSGYTFQNVQVGSSGFTLTATPSNGSSAAQSFSGTITSNGQVISHDFTLPVSIVSGTVYLFDGVTPAPYANVQATMGPVGSQQGAYVTADKNGLYQLSGLPSGQVTLVASDNNGVQGASTVTLTSSTQILTGNNISLEATGTVTGTVYDTNGAALADQYISVSSSADNNSFELDLQTDSNGSYVVTDIPVGNITVSYYDNSEHSATGVLLHNGDSITINIGRAANSVGTVFGTVYAQDGSPSSGAAVTAQPADGSTPLIAITDASGIYTIAGIPLGMVTVTAVLTDSSTTAPVTGLLTDAQVPIEVDLGLQDFGNVTGTIMKNGQPVAGASLALSSTGDNSTVYTEVSANDGTYGFGTIPAGTITLQVLDSQNNVMATATGQLPYGGNLLLNLTIPNSGSHLFYRIVPGRAPDPQQQAFVTFPVSSAVSLTRFAQTGAGR